MTPELHALSDRLAELFRDLAVPLVIAAQAGLDTAHLDLSDVVADRWWAVVERARVENKLAELVDVAEGRLGTHGGAALDKVLTAALDSLPAPKPPAKPLSGQHGQGQGAYPMSDYRSSADARIDQMMRDMSALSSQVAQLTAQVAQLNATVTRLVDENENRPAMSGAQLTTLLVLILATALVIFSTIYVGGNR